ncbi:MAG: carbohydrate-binding domain-containing protein [Eggerthellaceae bacterium]|nr:carbohydrate-binding domain-containing protein [Eggerthellaceae bacterium]
MSILICAALSVGLFSGCSNANQSTASDTASSTTVTATASSESASTASDNLSSSSSDSSANDSSSETSASASGESAESETPYSTAAASGSTVLDSSDMFTDRDLEQQADTSNAKTIAVSNDQDVSITEEGVYVLSGTATNVTVEINADDAAKVQLVLDGLSIANEGKPAIYVVSADKVFVTTTAGSSNELTVTGEFASTDSESNVDGAIFSKDDIAFNGEGTLTINSSNNGIVGKDDVKFTGGTYKIVAGNHAIQGKDSVRIADGTFNLEATKDGIHAENTDDQALGYVFIAGGTFDIQAGSDGIEGDAVVQIDGGTFNINAKEGIEGTYVQINDGNTTINASDDGINATAKSTEYDVAIEINGGTVAITMGSGDTDALDSNGSLIVNGGTVDITAQFAFDFVTKGELNGGTVTVNGEQVSEIAESMMMGGPGGQGGFGDQQGFSGEMPSGEMPSGEAPQGGHGSHGSHGPKGGMGRGSSDSAQPSTQQA